MNKELKQILFANILIIITLIPIVIIFNALTALFPYTWIWLGVGVGLLLLFSYLSYAHNEHKKIRGRRKRKLAYLRRKTLSLMSYRFAGIKRLEHNIVFGILPEYKDIQNILHDLKREGKVDYEWDMSRGFPGEQLWWRKRK